MSNKPLFRFNTQVVKADPSGYYIPRWDRAKNVTVLGHTRDEAIKKVKGMMGEPPHNYVWAVSIDSASEIFDVNQ